MLQGDAQGTGALEGAAALNETPQEHSAGRVHSQPPSISCPVCHPQPGGSALSHFRRSPASGSAGPLSCPWSPGGSGPRAAVP